jgi:hypothetical protein
MQLGSEWRISREAIRARLEPDSCNLSRGPELGQNWPV